MADEKQAKAPTTAKRIESAIETVIFLSAGS